jgi:hypothetical protein
MHLTVGCKVKWTESVYSPYIDGEVSDYIGERTISGRITADGYSSRNYHFFTIHVYTSDGVMGDNVIVGSKIIRRGVVIYPKCVIISKPDNYDMLILEKEIRKNKLK